MQTAIDWLMDQYVKDNGIFLAGVYEQAKEIEKKQHETTFHRGINIGAFNTELDIEGRKESAKHYYETTFENVIPKKVEATGNKEVVVEQNKPIQIDSYYNSEDDYDSAQYSGTLCKELTLDERVHLWFESSRPNRDVCDYVDEMNDIDKSKYLDECGISRTTKI